MRRVDRPTGVTALDLLFVVLVAPVVALAVALHAASGASARAALAVGVGVGAVSVSGFAAMHLFGDALVRAYLRLLKPSPVVSSPLELVVVHLVAGFAVAASAVAAYLVGSRSGRFTAE